MGQTLDTFYRSDKWRTLVTALRLERINEDGDTICEYCGEPIVRAYDCIGHHKEELDEDNVNDAMISLNPENIMLVHHRCHNRIHKKFYHGEDVRQVYLVYGSPMSGKTTWVREAQNVGDLIVDMDSIWQCISGQERYEKPGVLNANAFGVRDRLIEDVRYRRGKWRNAYVIGGYPLISERERLCRMLRAREVYIDTTEEECMRRLEQAEDGRDKEKWRAYIEEWWRRYTPPRGDTT